MTKFTNKIFIFFFLLLFNLIQRNMKYKPIHFRFIINLLCNCNLTVYCVHSIQILISKITFKLIEQHINTNFHFVVSVLYMYVYERPQNQDSTFQIFVIIINVNIKFNNNRKFSIYLILGTPNFRTTKSNTQIQN